MNNKKNLNPQQTTYNIWQQYNEFIRSLYLEKPLKKPNGKEKVLNYLSKIAIVFMGAFFTTLTFYFLIDPNGLYNSGLNGLLQVASKWLTGTNRINFNYYLLYYGLGLITNLLFIFILRTFFKAKLGIISTSIFYALSQIIWTQIFNLLNLREYIFNKLNPNSWQGLSNQSQLSFTLPYYIVIAIVAAIIHTYGYSLIFRAQATPGGLEIFTSYFSSQQKKNKISIGAFTKMFGFIVIFLVTTINFVWIEENSQIKKSALRNEMIAKLEKAQQEQNSPERKIMITELKNNEEKTKEVIKNWKKDLIKANDLEENNQLKESFQIKKKNLWLTSLLENKTGELQLENNPQEVDYYLLDKKGRQEEIEKELKNLREKIKSAEDSKQLKKKLARETQLTIRLKDLEKENNQGSFKKYLSYISNNERLWATLVYIFLASYLIGQIFPRDKIISLSVHSNTEESRNKGLKLLAKFSPIYYTVYRKKDQKEEVIHVINCRLSKWNYYLYSPYLKQIGKIYESN